MKFPKPVRIAITPLYLPLCLIAGGLLVTLAATYRAKNRGPDPIALPRALNEFCHSVVGRASAQYMVKCVIRTQRIAHPSFRFRVFVCVQAP